MYHISPKYNKREEEVRIGKIWDRMIIGKEIDCLVERKITIVIEVMDMVILEDEIEVIIEEVDFEVEIVVILEEILVGIEIEMTAGCGDNQDQEK